MLMNLPICISNQIKYEQKYESKYFLQGKCNGGNEHYACGSHCDEECGRLNQTCPIINIKCVDRCYCDEGYARDNRCKCVPKEYCNSC